MASERYRERFGVWAAVVLMIALLGGSAWCSSGTIGAADWQYQELDALSRAGLLAGHPQGPLSAWCDSLTRFEAASLVLRGVEGIAAAYQAEGQSLLEIAKAEQPAETEAPARASIEDVARVEKLIEEFRTELVAMGARVDDLATALNDVQRRLARVEEDQKKHRIDGYIQLRYSDDEAIDRSEFLVRRARINLRGPVSERVSYRLELQLDATEEGKGPTSKTQVRTAYVDYRLNQGLLRVGQAKVPWGYELGESSADLWAGERAFFLDRLFPNQRDIGVQWSYQANAKAPTYDLGLFNGTGINASDNNKDKNPMGRVTFPVSRGTVALSAYVGQDGAGAAQTDQDRFGIGSRLAFGRTEFMGEAMAGRDRGHDVSGWYAQLGHPIRTGRPNILFAKYDTYDENADASNNLFRRWTLGYWLDLDPATRLTFLYELRKPQPGFSEYSKYDGNAAFLQLRVKY